MNLRFAALGPVFLCSAALMGCQSTGGLGGLTPTQVAQIGCVLASDGTVIATAASTKAAANVAKIQGATAATCDAATQIGAILTPAPTGSVAAPVAVPTPRVK